MPRQNPPSVLTRQTSARTATLEPLEQRNLLAVVWANELDSSGELHSNNGFSAFYAEHAAVAQSLVNRAINDWNQVLDTNFDQDNDASTGADLEIAISATNLAAFPVQNADALGVTQITGAIGVSTAANFVAPSDATIWLDDNAAGADWYFDATPLHDEEFSSIGGTYYASFSENSVAGAIARADFYTTVLHEIGHALGARLDTNLSDINTEIYDTQVTSGGSLSFLLDTNPTTQLTPDSNDFFLGSLFYAGIDATNPVNLIPLLDPDSSFSNGFGLNGDEEVALNELWQYSFQDGSGRTALFTEHDGGHLYDPAIAAGLITAPDLMSANQAGSLNSQMPQIARRLISDSTAEFLADAYGYSLRALPSELRTMHATLDPIKGTLLVHGTPRDSSGVGADDNISININGDQLEVMVVTPNGISTEQFPLDQLHQILVAGHGGTDAIAIDPQLSTIYREIEYVVNSVSDLTETVTSANSGTIGDSIVDLDTAYPGSQITLRSAIQDANQSGASATIYLAPNPSDYEVSLSGSEQGIAAVNDFDITGSLTIIGAGAGRSIINAHALANDGIGSQDRLFDIHASGNLAISGVTLTGSMNGDSSGGGGAITVHSGGKLQIDQVAITGNSTTGSGAAIYLNGTETEGTITRSVFSQNTSDTASTIFADAQTTLRVGTSVFADTDSNGNFATSLLTSNATLINEGHNLVGHSGLTQQSTAIFDSSLGDIIRAGVTPSIITSMIDSLNNTSAPSRRSLREAVENANTSISASEIWAPGWNLKLTRTGSEAASSAQNEINDLDITGHTTIIGVGPGITAIDASGLRQDSNQQSDRSFQVGDGSTGTLTLEGISLIGGNAGTGRGGAIRVRANSELVIDRASIVDNRADIGGAIYAEANTATTLHRTSFTQNHAAVNGGAFYADQATSLLTIGETIFANNSSDAGQANINTVTSASTFTNEGNNLSDEVTNQAVFSHAQDHLGQADHVVTTIRDEQTFSQGQLVDSNAWRSLRESIYLTNRTENPNPTRADEIWVPNWNYVLTVDRTDTPTDNGQDTTATDGDLDIWGGNLIIGVAGSSLEVQWHSGTTPATFDFLGDFNQNKLIDTGDYAAWRDDYEGLPGASSLIGDADDNGLTELADQTRWSESYGHSWGVRSSGLLGSAVSKGQTDYVLPGDADANGRVDQADKDLVTASLGQYNPDYDWSGSSLVDLSDIQIVDESFGYTSPLYAAPVSATASSSSQLPRFINGYANKTAANIQDQAPLITGFAIGSSTGSHDFQSLVGSGEQLRSVDLTNADHISISFNEEVLVYQDALTLTNLDGASSASVVDFVFDISSLTATWVLDAKLADGRWLATVSDSVYDLEQDSLDGDFFGAWSLNDTGTATFPTGNGDAGGSFRFHFTVLENDTDHNNIDGTTDYTEWHSIEPGAIYVSTTEDVIDADNSFGDVSLREAVQYANANSGTAIYVPSGQYALTRFGVEANNASYGDLDILADTRLIGAGPGLTQIIPGAFYEDPGNNPKDEHRAFHIEGTGSKLEISGLTIRNANGYGNNSGGIAYLKDQAELVLLDSAVTFSGGTGSGVVIESQGANLTIRRSVFTNLFGMDRVAVNSSPYNGINGSLTIGESIFALNSAYYGSIPNVAVSGAVALSNEGNNLIDSAIGGFFDTTAGAGDYLGTPNFVVTTIEDSFNHVDNDTALSLREAVDLANQVSGLDEIWLPAWRFNLSRDRQAYGAGSATDIDTAFGDIDVKDQLIVRGVQDRTRVTWNAGVVDSVFDLIGDFNQHGLADQEVNSADLVVWNSENGQGTGTQADWEVYAADGDDDGDVDTDDAAIWSSYNANSLDLFDIAL